MEQQALITLCGPSLSVENLSQETDAPSLDPFHTIPVHYSEDVGIIADCLHSFFVGITRSTLPFDVADTHNDLTRGWLASVYSDEAVCSSFVTYCAWFYSKRLAPQCSLTKLSLENEARSLALLRTRIESGGMVTEGTLLAAALHFFIATFTTENVTQLSCVAKGIYTLVTAKGGSSTIVRNVSPSTMQSLIYVDVFNSLLSAEKPYLENIEFPSKPPSYDSLFLCPATDEAIASCLAQGVVDVLEDMRFAMFFRAPSQQSRQLSSDESRYLFMLLQKISYGLCNQQSQLTTSQSLSEIAILGMILVKEEVLLDVVQHPIMVITILQRLRSAVSMYTMPLHGSSSTVALWASIVALVGSEFESERTWALDFVTTTLYDRYGQSWPSDWIIEVRQELQQVLWHHRIEVAFSTICAKALSSPLNGRLIDRSQL